MNILYYTGITCVTVFSMIIMIHAVYGNFLLKPIIIRRFLSLFGLIAIAALAEWVGYSISSSNHVVIVLKIIAKCSEYSIAPIIPILAANIITDKPFKLPAVIFLAVNAVLEILSGVFGFMFYFSENGSLCHGGFYFIYPIIYLFATVYFAAASWVVGREYQKRNAVLLAMIFAFVTLGITLQTYDNTIRTDWIVIAFASIMYYIFHTQLRGQIDPITLVLDRRCYESYVSGIKKPVALVFFDVNNFKFVNDTYGHQFGDVCLNIIAQRITQSFGKIGKCFRVGGDEFCAVVTKPDMLLWAKSEFRFMLEQKQSADSRIPNVAIGSAMYDPEKISFDDAIRVADQNMYDNKNHQKKI